MMLWFSDTASFVTESNMYLTSCSAVTRCQTWIDENGNMDQTIDLRASSSIIRRIVALVRDYDKRAAVKILFNSCRDAYTNTRRYCSSPVDLLWSNHIQEDRQQLQGQHEFIMTLYLTHLISCGLSRQLALQTHLLHILEHFSFWSMQRR